MSLSADQQAMLQLMLERGQSYADLSSLLGVDEAEVRERARAALTELGGADPDRNVAMTDYLLGQADPIGRADAVRDLRDDPADRDLADTLIAMLGEIAPGAEFPRLPGEARTAPHLRAPRLRRGDATEAAPAGGPSWTSQPRVLAALASGAIILVAIVLAVSGAFGGGGSSTGSTGTTASTASTASTTPTQTQTTPSVKTRTLAPFPLTGVGGAAGSGVAKFGLATTGQPFIDIVLRDLPQPSSTEVYSIWLMTNPGQRQGTPLTPITLPASGAYHNRFPIPSAVIPLLSKGVKTVDISRAAIKPLQKEILAAQKAKKLVITEPGTTVLRGTIPASERGTGGSGGASTTPGG